MKITSVEFVKSVADLAQLPKDDLKEVAFAGRSNVGKSSLINCLLQRKKLAKISTTPGKTRHLNYFRINGDFYFVDLPGYGFAKVSKAERVQWQVLIESFLQQSKNLQGVVSLVDSRIGATELDLQLAEWLRSLRLANIIVATKTDKLSRAQLNRQLTKLNDILKGAVIPFSSVKGTGRKELWTAILNLMGAA